MVGKAKRYNPYDASVRQSRRTVENYGQIRQRYIGSTFRNEPLPPIATVLSTDTGTGTGTFCSASLAADQTTNITATDHVEFDTLDEDGGITLQTGAGQADGIFELSAGKKYYLSGALRPEFSGATGQLVVAWYDITNTAEIGKRAIYESQTHASNNANQPKCDVTFTPTTNVTVELRIISVTALTALATEYCQATIFEIALGGSSAGGAGGGGGTVSFPITPDINDHGNVGTTTEDLDLSATTGHIHKITLTGNPTLTFSNPPSSGTQIEFEIEFVQDATGGRTVTWPASVVETVSISTASSATTIVTLRTNDGGTNYHAIPALRGSISLSGGGNFANQQLNNLSAPTLNTDLDFGTYDAKDVDRIEFATSSGAVSAASTPTIFLDSSSNMVANIATAKSFQIKVQDTEEFNFTASALEMNDNQITEVAAIVPNDAGNDDIGSSAKYFDKANLKGIQFRGNDLSAPNSSSPNAIRTTASSMAFNLDNTNHNYIWYHNGVQTLSLSDTVLTAPHTVIVGDGTSGQGIISIADGTAIVSPANGYIYREGNDVKIYSGGAEVNISTIPATAATIELDNLGTTAINADLLFDAATYDIGDSTNRVDNLNVNTIRLRSSSGVANVPSVHSSTGSILDLNFPTGSSMILSENATSKYTWTATTFTAPNVIITSTQTLNDSSAYPTASGMFSRNGTVTSLYAPEFEVKNESSVAAEQAEIKIVKVDSTPLATENIGELSFIIRDTGVETDYASIAAVVSDVTDAGTLAIYVRANNSLSTAVTIKGDDNNAQYVWSYTDETRIISSSGNMGFFTKADTGVIDFSSNIGTSGTITLPWINDGSPSLTDLNQAFGAFDGAIGHDINDGKLYVRTSSGAWSYYSRDGTVT